MSDEQVVQHVLRNRTDFYKVLMVERTATADQVKSAYKRMALRCHPDKNKHAQAAEAFKVVGSANTTLCDATKRQVYDRAGVAGVQRHESTGGAAGPRRRGGDPRREFFEEFFFGGGGGGAGPFHAHPGGARTGGGGGGNNPNVHVAEFEINPNILMMIPVLIFILLALLLQSGFTDVETYSAGSENAFQTGKGASATASFSLTPSPNDGLVIRRMTSLYGLNVPYFTSRRWAEVMERRRDILMTTEQEVLKTHRDYLANRCEAETFKHRTRGRKDAPEVCSEYNRFRRVLG